MSFVTAAAMRSLEESAFRRGISAEALMDGAGRGIALRLVDHFPTATRAVGYVGKGNNAGDALVALAHLRAAGWVIALRSAYPESEWSPLAVKKRQELGEVSGDLPPGPGPLILLDGLLGIGAQGKLRAPLQGLAGEMASLREDHGAIIAAMDLPSGMHPDTGLGGLTVDLTLAIGAPKWGLITAEGIARSGRLVLVPLDDLPPPPGATPALFCPEIFPGLLRPRGHDFHKGHAGRVGILAGSPGMTGAAVLAASAALRAGAGLVTLHVEPDFLPSLASPMPAEVMVRASASAVADAFAAGHDALVIGPGTGNCSARWQAELLGYLAGSSIPAVLDADALNQLAREARLDLLAPHHLITPHPGEFRRLAPDLGEMDRLAAAEAFTSRHDCAVLLKGTRTVITARGEGSRLNPTGHAGMASGGQGDVLSGVAGAYLAGGMSPLDAGSLAAWLCGRAAERAWPSGSVVTASDTLHHLAGAARDWQERRR